MEPTARRDLQQQQQQLRPKNEIFLCRLQVHQRTHLLLHSLSSPSLPLLHYSDTLLSIWKFARLSGGQRQRQRRLRLDRIGTVVGQQWTGTGEKKLSVRQAANSWLQAAQIRPTSAAGLIKITENKKKSKKQNKVLQQKLQNCCNKMLSRQSAADIMRQQIVRFRQKKKWKKETQMQRDRMQMKLKLGASY